MSGIEAVFFDCDGTLVDSEAICSRAYVAMFQEFGITLDLEEVFKRFKGVKLYEIIDIINQEHGVDLAKADLEPVYRADPHNKPIEHPNVTTFTDLAQLPELWKARGWDITR